MASEFKKLSKKNNTDQISLYKVKKLLNLFNFFYKIALKLKKCYRKIKQIAYFINLQKEEKKSLFYSKLLPFAPKEPFRKSKAKNINHSLMTYKGRFYSLLQLQLLNDVSSRELKKNQKKLKYLYKKSENFILSFEYKLYILLYKLTFFHTTKESLNYIKKFGVTINFKLITMPNFFIKKHSFLQVPEGIFIKFINLIRFKSFIANFLISHIIYKILLNINTFTIYILRKNYNYITVNLKELFLKERFKKITNSKIKFNINVLLNGVKYFKKR